MEAIRESGDTAYWSIRVVPAMGFSGYVGEVYSEVSLQFAMTDPALAPVEGQWLHTNAYRTMTVYPTTAEAQQAAEHLRQFFDFAHLRG